MTQLGYQSELVGLRNALNLQTELRIKAQN
jgi:hypothetical protein